MSMKDIKKSELESEQLSQVTGGYFVVANGPGSFGSGTGSVKVTFSHYCKSCGHSWDSDTRSASCPKCGKTDLYIVYG